MEVMGEIEREDPCDGSVVSVAVFLSWVQCRFSTDIRSGRPSQSSFFRYPSGQEGRSDRVQPRYCGDRTQIEDQD